jgi:FMN-dependent NADH-azoreductase
VNLLHIDSSILGNGSITRELSTAIVQRLAQTHTNLHIVYRDLCAASLAHLSTGDLVTGQGGMAADLPVRKDIEASRAVLAEFLAADFVVVGAPMYNFGIPSQLKAWVDRILVANQTFRYTEHGAEGLATTKWVIVAASRGGIYTNGTPSASYEHVETYLKAVFGFIGVPKLDFFVAEGVRMGADVRERALATALHEISQLQSPK